MSLKNNVLSDRLNDFKNNPKLQNEINYPHKNSIVMEFVNGIILLITFFIKSAAFGFALKTIFCTDWRFLGLLCVGISINLVMQFISGLIHHKNN